MVVKIENPIKEETKDVKDLQKELFLKRQHLRYLFKKYSEYSYWLGFLAGVTVTCLAGVLWGTFILTSNLID